MTIESGAGSGRTPRETQERPAASVPDSGRPGAVSGQSAGESQSATAAPAPDWSGWGYMTWRQRARAVIKHATECTRAEGITDETEIIRRIDAAYPFGEREYYPYKAWLMERRIAKGLLRGQLVNVSPDKVVAQTQYKPVPELEAWLRARGGSVG